MALDIHWRFLNRAVNARRSRLFTLRELRQEIEAEWGHQVQIITYGEGQDVKCIDEIRFCFIYEDDLQATDCDERDFTWENRQFRLQTDLDGPERCPQV